MHNNCNNYCKTFLNTIPSSFIDCKTQRTTVALHTLFTYLSTAGLFVTACVCLYVCCRLSLNEKYSHRPPFALYLCWLLECLGVSLCLWAPFLERGVFTHHHRLLHCVRLILSVLLCLHLGESFISILKSGTGRAFDG